MRLRRLVAAWLMAAFAVLACGSPPAATEPAFTGVWTGPLPVGASGARTFAVQLHERADLKLMGYLIGGTTRRALLGAVRTGDRALLVFRMEDAGLAQTIILTGTISGDTLTGEATIESVSGSHAVTWTRGAGPLAERNFIFAPGGGGDGLMELSVVHDAAGALVAGNFTSEDCAFIACGGAVTAFTETPAGDLAISLETDGACAGAATLNASFAAAPAPPASPAYAGTWTQTPGAGCGAGPTSGALMGGRAMNTETNHIASVLANLGQFADDLETGAGVAAPYAPPSNAYLHFGETAAQFLAAANAESAAHASASVDFFHFTAIRTVVPAGHHLALPATPMASFSDQRSDAGGIYRAVAAGTPGESRLRYIREEAGAWRLIGNQVGEFDLPFAYALGAERLIVPTGPGGESLHLSLGGWGAHFSPLTGHLEGNAKADMMAQYVGAAGDLTELANGTGGAAGVCDIALVWSGSGEICGIYGGLAGELIRSRIFAYRAPYGGVVTEIIYEERPRSASAPLTHYFDNAPHWSVRIAFEGGLSIRFGHLGQLTGAERAGLIARTGIDPDAYAPSLDPAAPDYCPPSPARCQVELLQGRTFTIAQHDQIARAQTDAAPVPGHPGYWRAQIGPSIPPWSQVEFFMSEEAPGDSPDVCVYRYLPPARQSALAAIMTADMLNAQSLRYHVNAFVRPWKFRAEAELCNNGGYLFRNEADFSSIHSQLGGWFERAEGTIANEQFAIARIHNGAAAYDAALYDVLLGATAPTQYLVARSRTDGLAFDWMLPGGASVQTRYPTGEVLELTADGFLVKWREIGSERPHALSARGLCAKRRGASHQVGRARAERRRRCGCDAGAERSLQ